MNYNDLNEETQAFLNKAMDIFSTIENKNITRKVERFLCDPHKYQFTKLDKKVLSLFIAGFLTNGNLKEILSQYDDIKLDNLLDFIGIKEKDIRPVEDGKYGEFFDAKLKLDLTNIINTNIDDNKEINSITPEVIIMSLHYIHLNGSEILNYFDAKYQSFDIRHYFKEHPLFDALENYNSMKGSIKKIDSSRVNYSRSSSMATALSPSRHKETKPLPQTDSQQKAFQIQDNVWKSLEQIKKKFIGQETAVEGLFYNMVNNQLLAETYGVPDNQRSIIFMDGPSGTGKTAITREIAEKIGVPFISVSATNYSSTGYVGGNITDILKDLYIKAGGDLERAQRGIVVLDEFDKIAYSRSGGLEMKKAVQQQLLDFLGGGKYNVVIDDSIFTHREIEFDTSKLTFVCLGALTDLRSSKTESKQAIGFGQTSESITEQDYSITPQDLIDIGLQRELIGRLNTYLHTNDYSKEILEKILRKSKISPLIGFKKWVESQGKQLIIDEDVYDIIAEEAYGLNTGARGLQTIMNSVRTMFIKEVLRGSNDTIHLNSNDVITATNQIMNRKGR